MSLCLTDQQCVLITIHCQAVKMHSEEFYEALLVGKELREVMSWMTYPHYWDPRWERMREWMELKGIRF